MLLLLLLSIDILETLPILPTQSFALNAHILTMSIIIIGVTCLSLLQIGNAAVVLSILREGSLREGELSAVC